MKKIISIFLLMTCVAVIANANEVKYFNKSWAEVKAKAKAEHKYIFIDCYTDWCGWCKVMDKETMVDPTIVSKITDKFIAVKMDMEHGEGVKLAMKYHISSFPTFMFFNEDGEFVYQSFGYEKANDFIKELDKSLDKTKQFKAPGYSASIDIDFPEFYKKAHAENGKRAFPKTEEIAAFLDQQKDLFSEVSWAVICMHNVDDKHSQFFLDNLAKFKSLYGNSTVNEQVSVVLDNKLIKAIKAKSNNELTEVLKMVDKYVTEDPKGTKTSFKISYYKETDNWDKFAEAFSDYLIKNGYKSTNYINSECWTLYEKCDDKTVLKKATGWMKEVVSTDPSYANLDTYAALLYKTGQNKEAETWANKAIETGKKAGEKTTATEALLKKIKG
jgi:thioredoxin-related protein